MKVKIDSLADERGWQLILNPVFAIDSWSRKRSITFAWLFWTLSFEWERKK